MNKVYGSFGDDWARARNCDMCHGEDTISDTGQTE